MNARAAVATALCAVSQSGSSPFGRLTGAWLQGLQDAFKRFLDFAMLRSE